MSYPAHKLHTDQVHYLKAYVTYSDSGIVAGTKEIGTLPKNAFVINTHVKMATAGTAAFTVGTGSGTATSIATAGDINETVTTMQAVTGVGVLSSTTDLPVFVKWAQDTAGAAYIAISYIPFPPL